MHLHLLASIINMYSHLWNFCISKQVLFPIFSDNNWYTCRWHLPETNTKTIDVVHKIQELAKANVKTWVISCFQRMHQSHLIRHNDGL